jgi:hypothetical protein
MCHSGRVSPAAPHVRRAADPNRLLGGLAAAHDAAFARVGREPAGVRAVERAPGTREYLCAFAGPGFLCLSEDLRPAGDAARVREVAGVGLLWEWLEGLVDGAALLALADAVQVVMGCAAVTTLPGRVVDALDPVADRARDLALWRDEPGRALASLPDLDDAVALQERLHAAWTLFVRASEPLVEAQDALDPTVVSALGDLERAAGEARAHERLADLLAAALEDCGHGAEQVAAAHLTPVADPGTGPP